MMEIIKPPKDAEGREIPRNTWAMYDANGKKLHITSFTYKCDTNGFWSQWKVFSPDIRGEKDGMLPAESLYLTPPDSWEKLLEDLDKGKDICDYYEDCPTEMHGKSCSECKKEALKNIASRIRKLMGEGE